MPIEYPEELTAGRGSSDEKYLKFLYKNFVTNFEEAMKESKTPPFIIATLKEIKYKFEGTARIMKIDWTTVSIKECCRLERDWPRKVVCSPKSKCSRAKSLLKSSPTMTRSCTLTKKYAKTSEGCKGSSLREAGPVSTKKWRNESTRTLLRSADSATKRQLTAKTRNRYELLISLWLASCDAMPATKAGETDWWGF